MTRLAVNDTPLSRKLLAACKLDVDFLETSGPHVESAVTGLPEARFLLHNSVWDWSLGHPAALERNGALRLTRHRLAQTQAPWLSAHLAFSAAEVAFEDGMRPLSQVMERDELLANITRSAAGLASSLEVPLLLENMDYNPTGAYEHICEPAFIREVLEEANAGFLLDLAHARVSAARLGYEIEDYLAALPLDRVRQLHVSGPRRQGGTLTDAHEPLQEEDYALLRKVMGTAQPWAITLEYGKDEGPLLEQIGRLTEMV